MTRLVLDVDTGTDDAVAVMCAALHPELELIGVGTVNGNVSLAHTTENTLRVLDHIGCGHIPVNQGAAQPIVRDCFPDGTRNRAGLLDLPAAASTPSALTAAEFLVQTFMGPQGTDTVLVPTGPLTNIALAIRLEPRIVERVRRVVLMGGAYRRGNRTAVAESNIWMDPEAARIVFRAGFRDLTMVPLDATHQALITSGDCDRLESAGTPAALAAAAFTRQRIAGYGKLASMSIANSAPLHDALCVAALVRPEVLRDVGRHAVDIETSGELTVGQTVFDTRALANVTVALGADRDVFAAFLLETLSA